MIFNTPFFWAFTIPFVFSVILLVSGTRSATFSKFLLVAGSAFSFLAATYLFRSVTVDNMLLAKSNAFSVSSIMLTSSLAIFAVSLYASARMEKESHFNLSFAILPLCQATCVLSIYSIPIGTSLLFMLLTGAIFLILRASKNNFETMKLCASGVMLCTFVFAFSTGLSKTGAIQASAGTGLMMTCAMLLFFLRDTYSKAFATTGMLTGFSLLIRLTTASGAADLIAASTIMLVACLFIFASITENGLKRKKGLKRAEFIVVLMIAGLPPSPVFVGIYGFVTSTLNSGAILFCIGTLVIFVIAACGMLKNEIQQYLPLSTQQK